ncbi:HWE histidine kinase domain-containing protein [Methylobacterium sp. ID0610]|uniref:HWE histidine kinase domain-containing protein n=1 Tax=Methylobacterium carpenticola TaxID=3344827 RepID=UPI00367A0DEE
MRVEHGPDLSWPRNGGGAGALMRARNWSRTALGPPAAWPEALRGAVDLILPSPVPMALAWGPRGWMLCNDAVAALTGTPLPEAIGGRLDEIWPDLAAADALAAAMAGRAVTLPGCRLGPAALRVDLGCSPLRDAAGRPAGMLAVLHRAESAGADSVRQARAQVGELKHQIRNTLGAIRAVIRRGIQASETLEDLALHLQGRIDAIARPHSLVSLDPAIGADLSLLIAEELLAHHAHEGRQLSIGGPAVQLPARLCGRVALAIHELATNAINYGALADPAGRIAIDWQLVPDGPRQRVVLTWKETGLALAEAAPRRRGFGTELLESMLPYELKADVVWRLEPDGLRCTIALPLG